MWLNLADDSVHQTWRHIRAESEELWETEIMKLTMNYDVHDDDSYIRDELQTLLQLFNISTENIDKSNIAGRVA